MRPYGYLYGAIRDTGRGVAYPRQITDRTGCRRTGAKRDAVRGGDIRTSVPTHRIAVDRSIRDTGRIAADPRQITDRTGRRRTRAKRDAVRGGDRRPTVPAHRIAVDRTDVFCLISFAFDARVDE